MTPAPTNQPPLPAAEPVPPDLLAWAKQTFDAEQFLREIREMEATGGRTFESFADELKTRAGVGMLSRGGA